MIFSFFESNSRVYHISTCEDFFSPVQEKAKDPEADMKSAAWDMLLTNMVILIKMSQECHKSLTRVLNECYKSVTRVLNEYGISSVDPSRTRYHPQLQSPLRVLEE
jgi:hypothetical protein